MHMQTWIWRSIGLAIVALAVIVALWLMGQVGAAIGNVDLATPTITASATATVIVASPTASASGGGPGASANATPSPSPTPKH